MRELVPFGRMLIVVGLTLLVVGALLTLARVPRLPGDIVIKRDTFVLFIPIVTSIVLSVVLTLVLSLFLRR